MACRRHRIGGASLRGCIAGSRLGNVTRRNAKLQVRELRFRKRAELVFYVVQHSAGNITDHPMDLPCGSPPIIEPSKHNDSSSESNAAHTRPLHTAPPAPMTCGMARKRWIFGGVSIQPIRRILAVPAPSIKDYFEYPNKIIVGGRIQIGFRCSSLNGKPYLSDGRISIK